jgi:hypothetical protein
MSWLYSRALVEEYSGVTSSDGEPSAPLNGNLTQLAYLPPDKMTAFSRLSRFGMTFKPLTADRGEALLTLYLADFRAKTSASQERGLDLMGSAQGCGEKWRGSSARYDPDSRSWKTHQFSLLGGLTEFSETWPRWGLMRNGELFPQQTLVPPTGETESGLWQTPVADDSVNRKKGKWNSRGEPKLSAQVLWPTPTATFLGPATGEKLAQRIKNRKRPSFLSEAIVWPTPTTSEAKSDTLNIQNRINKGKQIMLCDAVRMKPQEVPTPQHGGALNPTWVEWLMGWPLGWSDLRPLEMDRFHSWQRQHLNCSLENKNS